MITPSPKQLFSLSLAALLCLPAVPVSAAGATAGDVDLNLERVLAFGGATFPAGAAAVVSEDSAVVASDRPVTRVGGEADLTGLNDVSRMHQVAAEKRLEDQARGGGGFGRWLKKHWYVPVLAAAAVVALAGGDSDDPNDPED